MNALRVGRLGPLAGLTAVIAAVALVAALLISLVGASPADALQEFLDGAFGSPTNVGQTITGAVPLLLVALGWIVTFRAGRIHVGFPGQILIGGLCAAAVALNVGGLPSALQLILSLLAGIVGGGLYAGVAAWLWASRGVQEIVSTLLLNLVALQVVAWAVRGPLQETVGNQPQTDPFPDGARWPTVSGIEGQTLSWDAILIPLAVIAVVFVLRWTTAGFRLRLVGANAVAARHAGYSPVRIGVMAMIASGALAGLAGACLLLAGDTPGMTESFEAENGFHGIAVALLAFNGPVGAILAAVLFSALSLGSGSVEAALDVPSTIATVIQGLVILLVLVAATVLARNPRSTSAEDT
ncbi:MAG: ABC transporter permease [Solirubrobacteraceae bacterium]